MLAETGAADIARGAVHRDFRFGFRLHDLIIHEALRVFKR